VLPLAAGAIFISALDLTVVNVVFPDMRADFPSASLPTLSWVITAYGVSYAALLAPAGRIADVIGQQRLFVWSVAAFTVTSALAATAPNEGFLIFFRALQGASASGMTPAALGLILTRTPRERLMAAFGIWGATGSVAAAAGPMVGGVLVQAWDWRAIFLVNVPLGLAVLYGGTARLARDEPGGRQLPDPVGTVSLVAGTGAVVVSLTQGSTWGWTSSPVLLSLAGGLLGVGLALARSAPHPVPALELGLWRDRTFTVANAATLLFSASMFAFMFNGPLFLTATWDFSVLAAGMAVTPAAVATGLGSVAAGKLATTPASRRAAATGSSLLVATACFFLWARLGTEERFAEVYLPASLAAGTSAGFGFTALFGAGATSVARARPGSGSGVLTMIRQLGGALGVAAAAAILAAGNSAAVGSFLSVYLFSGVMALMAASASVGLVRRSPRPAAWPPAGAARSSQAARSR
jgi:EmrB/QacA subfamily drug resistance transporter